MEDMIENTENSAALANLLNERMKTRTGGNNQRLAQMLGWFTRTKDNPIQVNIPDKDRSAFSQVKWKFLLFAPFEICNLCCNVMKKNPSHDYNKKSGRHPMTAQMADESRLRTQKWLKSGCNGFDLKNPISNPMAFWLESDVLEYVKTYGIELASVYGEVVRDNGMDGQMSLFDFGLCGECGELKTTGCRRTGCIFCAYGAHHEKYPNRFESLSETHPNLFDYCMRGGEFVDGLWKPDSKGLGMWFPIKWMAVHGGISINIPNMDYYEKTYGNEETKKHLMKREEMS